MHVGWRRLPRECRSTVRRKSVYKMITYLKSVRHPLCGVAISGAFRSYEMHVVISLVYICSNYTYCDECTIWHTLLDLINSYWKPIGYRNTIAIFFSTWTIDARNVAINEFRVNVEKLGDYQYERVSTLWTIRTVSWRQRTEKNETKSAKVSREIEPYSSVRPTLNKTLKRWAQQFWNVQKSQ